MQRKVVFGKDMDGIVDIAVQGARLIKQLTEEEVARSGMNIRYEYSPESFTGTKLISPSEFAKQLWKKWAPLKKINHPQPAFYRGNVHC